MNNSEMKSKTSRRPSFLAKPGMGRLARRRELVLLPPKRSLAFEHQLEVGREAADERRIEIDWRDKSKSNKIWEWGEDNSNPSGVSKYDPVSEKMQGGEEKSDEKRKVSNEKMKARDEKRKFSDEKRKVSDEKRKVSDEKGKVSDEKKKVGEGRRKLSDERRRQMSEKAKEEGRKKLSQFIRKEIVYPHLLQVRLSLPIFFSENFLLI